MVANLGDSRAVLGRKTDHGVKAIQLTTDLKPCVPCKSISEICRFILSGKSNYNVFVFD